MNNQWVFRLTVLSVILGQMGCLFTPPIVERPEDLDDMFVIDTRDISPGVDTNEDGLSDVIGRVTLDRTLGQTQRFGVTSVRDVADETIQFQYKIFLTFPFARETDPNAELREADEQEGGYFTLYEGPFFEFDPCAIELANRDSVTIQLRLTDAIPEEQQPQLGRSEYQYDITWVVDLIEDCPLEEP